MNWLYWRMATVMAHRLGASRREAKPTAGKLVNDLREIVSFGCLGRR